MHRDATVEVIRVPHLPELAAVPTLVQVLEVVVARRRDRVLTTVDATTEVLAAAGRRRGDQDRLPVLEDREHLRVEVDLDAVALRLRERRLVLEVLERELDHGPDASVALQAVELLDRGDCVRGVCAEHPVDPTRVEVQGLEALLVCGGDRTVVAPAQSVGRDVGELHDSRLVYRRDGRRGRRRLLRRGRVLRRARALGDQLVARRGRRGAVVAAGDDDDRADRGRGDQDRDARDETEAARA